MKRIGLVLLTVITLNLKAGAAEQLKPPAGPATPTTPRLVRHVEYVCSKKHRIAFEVAPDATLPAEISCDECLKPWLVKKFGSKLAINVLIDKSK